MNQIDRPAGVFRGCNIMTPHVLAHYKLREGYAELSQGDGITGGGLYGVTLMPRPRADGLTGDCFRRKADALAYIEGLS